MPKCYSGPPKLPTFNLLCSIWKGLTLPPPMGAATYTNVPCQLVLGDLVFGAATTGIMYLKVPKLTDVHYARHVGMFFGNDLVECPQGSGHYYNVLYVNDAGKGFMNEHRVCRIVDTGNVPDPLN